MSFIPFIEDDPSAHAASINATNLKDGRSTPVSVLIPARNEETNIDLCLSSVAWAGEVVVADSGSTDRTGQIALRAGARVEQFNYVPGGPRKKNWALKNLAFKHDWILILDADERVTPALALEIDATIRNPGCHTGFYINRRFNFLGRWIYHSGYYPSWNLRLFKRGSGLYETLSDNTQQSGDNEVHEHIVLDGTAGYLDAPMDHFAFPTLGDFIEKHKRYAYWEAEMQEKADALSSDRSAIARDLEWRRSLKRFARRFPFPHWLRFGYHYFLKKGYLDGTEGYIFCHLLAEYEFWISVRRFELKKQRGAAPASGRPSEP